MYMHIYIYIIYTHTELRDHFVVEGDVEALLYKKEYVHTDYLPKSRRPAPQPAVRICMSIVHVYVREVCGCVCVLV